MHASGGRRQTGFSRAAGLVASVGITLAVALWVHRPQPAVSDELPAENIEEMLQLAGRLDQASAAEAARLAARILEIDPTVWLEPVADAILAAIPGMRPASALVVLDHLAREARSSELRARAIEGLASRSRLGWLAALATAESDPGLRELAVRRVAEAGRPIETARTGFLVEASYDVHGGVRAWACRAMAAGGPAPSCARALTDHLEDPIRAVSNAAAGALIRRRDAGTLDARSVAFLTAWLRRHPERRRAIREEPRFETRRRRQAVGGGPAVPENEGDGGAGGGVP